MREVTEQEAVADLRVHGLRSEVYGRWRDQQEAKARDGGERANVDMLVCEALMMHEAGLVTEAIRHLEDVREQAYQMYDDAMVSRLDSLLGAWGKE